MKKIIGAIFILMFNPSAFSQVWVDTTYEISSVWDVSYGVSTDFKGSDYILEMDMSVPTNDLPPDCGRPLMIIVHGGAWYSGDKADAYPRRLREDFAKRGYVSASVNYRLGLFNTNRNINCNLGGWNCWNMTDTAEWYRANYRAIQDVRGAIRYLVNNQASYHINPDNIFLTGESAGGFVVLGVGFIDDTSEVLTTLIDSLPDAPAPHVLYENDCIKAFGLANSIAEMNFNRPHLGSVDGELHFPLQDSFRIRGVGSFYGAAFNNIFEDHKGNGPALYLFHQPCDLIVPFNYSKLLAGYSSCATGFPTFCQHIINRPFAHGSNAITGLIDDFRANNIPTSEYLFDKSTNNYPCLDQVLNPSLGCHAIDGYWLRTVNMATFFADEIVDCSTTNSADLIADKDMPEVYPNPTRDIIHIQLPRTGMGATIRIFDSFGREIIQRTSPHATQHAVDISDVNQGIYQLSIELESTVFTYSIVKI